MRRFPKEHIMSNKQLFNDPVQRKRYICALLMILLMVGVSELMGEKEIIFPVDGGAHDRNVDRR